MIVTALVSGVIAAVIVNRWDRRPSRLRLAQARQRIGRLAGPARQDPPPEVLALPTLGELRDPCGRLAAFRCGCVERGTPPHWADPVKPRPLTLVEMGDMAAETERRPPWYREIPMPRPPDSRKD